MKWKILLVPVLVVVFTLQVCSHKANAYTLPGTLLHSGGTGIYNAAFHPPIESILYNPAVYKKQLSRDIVRAVGYNPAGETHFMVHFRKEELHGEWGSFYGNDQRCDSGSFQRNLPTGEWKTWYPNGQLKTVRTYSAEKYRYIKADVQRNHPKHQQYAITRLAVKGAAHYFQPQYDDYYSGSRASINMLRKIQYNTSGSNGYLPPFTNCLHHGLFINYDENGNVKDSGHYVNGLPNGLWKKTMNGTQALGFYKHGVRRGQWKYYGSDGRLVYTEHYNRNGKRNGWHYFKK